MTNDRIKDFLTKYGYTFLEMEDSLNVKLGFALHAEINFSADGRILVKNRLGGWNFLTGMLEMNLSQALLYNFAGIVFISALFLLLLRDTNFFYLLLAYLFILSWVIFWGIFYHHIFEHFKTRIMLGDRTD